MTLCVPLILLMRRLTANNATCKANNVRLTTMDAQQFSMAAIYPSYRKADLPETRDNDTKTRKVYAD